jgi:hypothetical protein
MKINIEYPVQATFEIKGKLPPFKYPCKKRVSLLHKFLLTRPSVNTESMFYVEEVELINGEEYWYIGS